MLTVILGAGASYDSYADIAAPGYAVNRPPLAQELFSERFSGELTRHPQCLPIIDRLRVAANDDKLVETELARLLAESEDYRPRASQLLAVRFYLRSIIEQTAANWYSQTHGVTNYVSLVDRLYQWSVLNSLEVGFITFNYDQLLEFALSAFGREFRSMDDYIDPAPGPVIRVIKPHGSCNWSRRVSMPLNITDRQESTIVNNATQITEEDDYWVVPRQTPLAVGQAEVPAIALPVDDKHQFVCPGSHLEQMRRMLRTSETVLIIGWRGTESHFAGVLAEELQNGTSLFVANGTPEDGGKAINSLQEHGVNQFQFRTNVGPGFTDLLRGDDLDIVLARAAKPIGAA